MNEETVKTNVYRVVLLVVDHDRCGADGIKSVLENANYPNDCIAPHVMRIDSREVDWSDAHPLNHRGGTEAEFARLFP